MPGLGCGDQGEGAKERGREGEGQTGREGGRDRERERERLGYVRDQGEDAKEKTSPTKRVLLFKEPSDTQKRPSDMLRSRKAASGARELPASERPHRNPLCLCAALALCFLVAGARE